MQGWFSKEEGKHYFEYLQELLDDLNKQLVTNPKRWTNQIRNEGVVVSSVLEDKSDFIRGQMVVLEQLINLPNTLRQGIKRELAALIEEDKGSK